MALSSATRDGRPRLGPPLRATWWALAGLSLLVRSGFPVHAIGDAGLDDALFLRLARTLGSGEWLGPFNNTTLVKGMFHPVFILGSFLLGIPLKLAEQGVYLAAAVLLCAPLVRGPAGRWGATLLFAALALNPVVWTVELARVMREGLYLGLSLLVVGLAASVLFSTARPAATLVRGLLLGLALGAFWTTREEGVWLLPALATLLALRLGAAALVPRERAGLLAGAGALALAGCGMGLVVGGNVVGNDRVYGMPIRLEVSSPAFTRAYGALSRIAHDRWQRYVVFPADARQLAYRVSPAARELQPFLEGEVGATWRRTSCGGTGECPEILASWFLWALRDAVAAAGHYGSLPEAMRFYDRLAREIDDACDGGLIPCLPPRATLAPPFRSHFVADTLERAVPMGLTLLRLGGDLVRTAPSAGPAYNIDAFEDAVGLVLRRPAPITTVSGRLEGTAGPPTVSVRPAANGESRSDVATGRKPGNEALGFVVSTDCPEDACALLLWSGETVLAAPPLDGLKPGTRLDGPGFTLHVDAVNHRSFRRGQTARTALFAAAARPVGRLLAAVMPAVALLGTLALLLLPLLRRWDLVRSPLFALVAASAAAVLCRLGLIAFLDATAIPSVGILYLSPATPFVIVLGVGGLLLLAALRRPGSVTIGNGR